MTTIKIYRSSFVDSRIVMRSRRKHGRPRGHRRYWVLRIRTVDLHNATLYENKYVVGRARN